MIDSILSKIIGTKHERDVKKLQPYAEQVNSLEPSISRLSDQQLRAKTAEFKQKIEAGASLDDILAEAFAVVREIAKRTIHMRHFDVQIIGGVVLHQGKIAEMKTGEGKTLVATLAVYLNALLGKGVHVVTVNDYLARRDSEWMGPIYKSLGLSVGTIQHELDDSQRKQAYACDVTYGTNNEFGFDYLRDNMKFGIDDYVQRGHHYAIVDEVDSILIDEARTPLIISGPAEESTEKYYVIDRIIPHLKRDTHYEVDEKSRTATLTEPGVARVETLMGVKNLYDPAHMDILHGVYQALKAHALFKRDVDYMVKVGQVIIVDEFTGRLMPGRRYSEGLHQALEAKESVKIEAENQTLASVTFQNYFRMYEKLAGMTGTADTEAMEFNKIYNLDVVVITTNKPLWRDEYPDVIYRTEDEKFEAVISEIVQLHQKEAAYNGKVAQGQPVLVGTVSIEKSERLSRMLKKRGIKHVVLNAKYHEKEAEIVAQAGQAGAVTIATNMAGRGTDIVLGEGVTALGGLHITGTERHEARRIDNQLRGRAGRQGDPGSSRFYLSLEDDLMRIFGMDRISGIMSRLGMETGVPIEHQMVTKAIERAQKQVEGQNFNIRKNLLEYDDVMNKQREAIYSLRREILTNPDQREYILDLAQDILDWLLDTYANEDTDPKDWDVEGLSKNIAHYYGINMIEEGVDAGQLSYSELRELLWEKAKGKFERKEKEFGSEAMRMHERMLMLQIVDSQWKDHLYAMDHLKEGIGLRGYAQQDPLVVYKRESFEMFRQMKERIEDDIVRFLFLIEPAPAREEEVVVAKRRWAANVPSASSEPVKAKPVKRDSRKIGRNDPCPCGSGKKYKKCCYLKGVKV
ncbi:MAG: preprotein translocase subunit SecA [Candidatus Aminicenantes bacterium]|nr:preprotein translocase subunit SecA [Candidatus Aminicenantes bacterium]